MDGWMNGRVVRRIADKDSMMLEVFKQFSLVEFHLMTQPYIQFRQINVSRKVNRTFMFDKDFSN